LPKYDNHFLKPEKHISITVMFTHHLSTLHWPLKEYLRTWILFINKYHYFQVMITIQSRYSNCTEHSLKLNSNLTAPPFFIQWLQNLTLSTPTPMLFKISQPKPFSLACLITLVDDFCLILHVNSCNVSVYFKMTFSKKNLIYSNT
jgi:hypothetical protein